MTREQLTSLEHAQDHDGNRLFLHRLNKDLQEEDLEAPELSIIREGRRPHDGARQRGRLQVLEAAGHGPSPRAGRLVQGQLGSIQPPSEQHEGSHRETEPGDDMWRLITRVGFESAVWHVPEAKPWVDAQRIHGVVTAEVAAHLVGEAVQGVRAGLMHSIGKLSVYRAAVRHRRGPAPENAFVIQICNQFYAQLGVLIARTWDLDPPVVAAIGFHNSPNKAPAVGKREAWMVHLGNILAHTATAEAEGMDTHGRMVIEKMSGVQFDLEEAMDVAHDALSEAEAFIAAQDEEAEN